MSELLTDLLAAGLIEKLEGDDSRFAKIEVAVETVANSLRQSPPKMIGAILAGLDPDIPTDDPSIVQAQTALTAQWKSMSSVYPEPPVGMLRAILLDASNQVATGKNAALLWLTAADTLPLLRLGKEESVIRQMLARWATVSEETALSVPSVKEVRKFTGKIAISKSTTKQITEQSIDRPRLSSNVLAAAGPHNTQGQAGPSPNPYWPNNNQNWVGEFSKRMEALLAEEFNAVYTALNSALSDMADQLEFERAQLIKVLEQAISNQHKWIQDTIAYHERRQQSHTLRLNALWWSEALYSQSLQRGYREIDPILAAIVMPMDLLRVVSTPTPASVAYLLTETVHRLPNARADERHALIHVFQRLQDAARNLPTSWLQGFHPTRAHGRLSLRDAILVVLSSPTADSGEVIHRAGLAKDTEFTLPQLARALFRQEQAVQLANEEQ